MVDKLLLQVEPGRYLDTKLLVTYPSAPSAEVDKNCFLLFIRACMLENRCKPVLISLEQSLTEIEINKFKPCTLVTSNPKFKQINSYHGLDVTFCECNLPFVILTSEKQFNGFYYTQDSKITMGIVSAQGSYALFC
jgi:hypothetical protein